MKAFSYEFYGSFLEKAKSISKIYSFEQTLLDKDLSSGIILRHDIDLSLKNAYKMFLIEKSFNVSSTYFILTTGFSYNPMEIENRKIIKEISDNGCEIGLHFDPSVYGDVSRDELDRLFMVEISILESIIGNSIKSVSLHKPSIHNMYPAFKHYVNAYDEKFFNNEIYISDSCMDFRGKDIFEFIEKSRNQIIQVLLHPMNFSEDGRNYEKVLIDYLEGYTDYIDNSFRVNWKYNDLMRDRRLIGNFK